MRRLLDGSVLRYAPLGIFLFSLPFAHTIALRLASLLAALLLALASAERSNRVANIPLKVPLALWAGFALLSLAWAENRSYSLGEIWNEVGYTMVAFCLCYAIAANEQAWRFFSGVLVASFIAISAVGLFWYFADYDQNTNGPHGGVGAYSTYLVTLLPLLLVIGLCGARRGIPANSLALLIPLLLLDGYGTRNRAFWPAVILAFVTFALLYSLRTRSARLRGKVLALAVAIVMVGTAAFVVTVKQRAEAPAVGSGVALLSEDPRLPLWAHVASMIERQPLTGGGFGRGVYERELRHHFPEDGIWHGHNLFLNYALQMGVGGVLVLTILLGAIGREFWRLYRAEDPIASLVGMAGISMLIAFVAKNMTDDFFVRQNSLMFWSLVGLSLGYGQWRAAQASPNAPAPASPHR